MMDAPVLRHANLAADSARNRVATDIVVCGGMAWVYGLGPVDLSDDRKPLPELVEDQVAKIFDNLELLLRHAGIAERRLLGVQARLVDFDRLIKRFDAAYIRRFAQAPLPTRSCIGVQRLTRSALVEMDFLLQVST